MYFASCFAFPWDISGESAVHRAVLDSHVLAVAQPEVPAVVCTGCFLHTAEASSFPSDPLGLKAANQVTTHDAHPATSRNRSQLPQSPEESFSRLAQGSRSSSASSQVLNPPSYILNYSRIPAALSNLQTQRTSTRRRGHFMLMYLPWPEDRRERGKDH